MYPKVSIRRSYIFYKIICLGGVAYFLQHIVVLLLLIHIKGVNKLIMSNNNKRVTGLKLKGLLYL